jgi:hypothetical protein
MKAFYFSIGAIVFAALVLFSEIPRIVVARSQQQQRPPMYVLQVGIGKYLNAPKWTDLRGSINDVMEMRKVLESDRYKIPAANIVTLTDDKATKQGIFNAYQSTLIANAKKYYEATKKRDAVVMFQFSGHGSQVPDVDGDEKDGLDETLVTYDSQDIKGKNFDITDDEIFALTSELKKYTDNIVYIFDSCHSGSGTRAAEDARRLPPRTTVPEPVALPFPATRSGRADDGSDGSVMPPGDDYIVISAAQANQIATQKYCFEECGSDKEPVVFGLLSYYLIDELKNARSDTNYRELMDSVSKKVEAERPSQVPLVEGDERRTVFGSLGSSEDAFVPVLKADAPTVRIRAGAIQGVSVGSVVSFYDRSVTKFDSAEKIATGSVLTATATEATVKIQNPKRALSTADKAVVASPDLGTSRTKVMLDSSAEPSLAKAIRDEFAPKNSIADTRGVDVLSDMQISRQTGRWGVAVLRDKYSKVFPRAQEMQSPPDCGAANADSDVYYIAGQDYVPLFGYCVDASPERSAENARSISSALTHIARYRSIQQIQNRRSRLAGKVIVKPIRLVTNSGSFDGRTNCVDGKFTADKYEPVGTAASGKYSIGTGEVFWFEVTNNSPFDLYVAMLNLQSDGSVKVKFPRNIDEEKDGVLIPKNGGKRIVNSDRCRINADGEFIETGAFRTSRQPETDSFKFLITTSRLKWEDLSYLEMDSLKRNGNASLATINEWIAIDLVFEVGGQVNK